MSVSGLLPPPGLYFGPALALRASAITLCMIVGQSLQNKNVHKKQEIEPPPGESSDTYKLRRLSPA